MSTKDQVKILGDLQNQFPIGVVDPVSNRLVRNFEVGDWTMAEEEKISEAREQADTPMGQFVSHVLAVLVNQLGPHNFKEMKFPEKLMMVSSLYVADVLYAYVFIRHQFYGKQLKVQFTCPVCKKPSANEVDLTDLDVRCAGAETATELREEVLLSRPIQMEQPAAKLLGVIYEPSRWVAVESLPQASATNRAKFLRSMFKSSCAGLIWEKANPEQTMPELLTDSMVDKFSKMDLEMMAVAMDKINRGPVLRAAVECMNAACRAESEVNIDWSYDSFFTT